MLYPGQSILVESVVRLNNQLDDHARHEWSAIFWSSIVNAIFFFAIDIAIGDLHLVKRSMDDRDREIQWSRLQKSDRDLFSFFQQSTFSRSNISKIPELKEWKFRIKTFGCIKQLILQMSKLAYETYDKYISNTVSKMIAILNLIRIEIGIAIAIFAIGVIPWIDQMLNS